MLTWAGKWGLGAVMQNEEHKDRKGAERLSGIFLRKAGLEVMEA